jgi:hypothetical protein
MSMRDSATRLASATRQLTNRWQETKYYWRDRKSEEFERKYMNELTGSVDRTIVVMEQLDKLLATIKEDCE